MGDDEEVFLRLWREKRGEAQPPDYSDNLIVQLGVATEPLNRRWYERTTGQVIKDVQRWVRHPVIRWMAATLDGIVGQRSGVRSQIHVALVVFGGDGGGEAHGPTPAQHVGGQCHGCGALDYHRRRQMGRDQGISRFALPAPPTHGRKKILALR